MKKIIIIIGFIALIAAGCAQTTSIAAPPVIFQPTESIYNVDYSSYAKADRSILYLYVLIEQIDGHWRTINVSDKKQPLSKGQERFKYRIKLYNGSLSTSRSLDFKKDHRSWNKVVIWQKGLSRSAEIACSVYGKTDSYTPCTSSLSTFVQAGAFFIAGNNYYKMDKKKIALAVQEANLDAVVKEPLKKITAVYAKALEEDRLCIEKLEADLQDYEKNLKITNHTNNITGYAFPYKHMPKVHRDFGTLRCRDKDRPLRYYVSLNFDNVDGFKHEVQPKSKTIYYPKDTSIDFKTEVLGAKFDKLTFNKTASDKNLEIVMHNVSNGTTPTLDLTLKNKSKGYLEIEYLTFKYNDLLCTKNLKDSPLVLPPSASKDYSMTINCKEVIDRINGILSNTFTKSFADSFIGHYGLTAQYSGKVLDFSYETHLTDILVK
ncbi:MAG: hypothetical protein C0603_10580 [Denitrovibrio sp.]|nr:MAG: hypothetical protein C0603_10580 [Denitrovibrio sp.]